MKFRAKLTDSLCMGQIADIIRTFAKLTKTCVIRISKEKLYLIAINENLLTRDPIAWCTLEQSHYFEVYKMEGSSVEDNEIFLEFAPDMLAKSFGSLKSTQTAVKWIKLKLTNKKSPCLTSEIRLETSVSHSRLCIHDIPVSVISSRLWCNYEQPSTPDYDVGVQMPSLRLLRSVAERMRSFSPYVVITAGNDGSLLLNVENSTVQISTEFRDLPVEAAANDGNKAATASARIDIKNFIHFTASELLNLRRIVCYILEDKLMHVILEDMNISLNYYFTSVLE